MFTTTHLGMANETIFDQLFFIYLKIGRNVTIIQSRPLQDYKPNKFRFGLPRNSSSNPNRSGNTNPSNGNRYGSSNNSYTHNA